MIRFLLDNPILVFILAVFLVNALVSMVKKRPPQEARPEREARPARPQPGDAPMNQEALEANVRRAMDEMTRDARQAHRQPKPKPAAKVPAAKPKPAPQPAPALATAPAIEVQSLKSDQREGTTVGASAEPPVLQWLRLGLDRKNLARTFLLREILDRPLAERPPAAPDFDAGEQDVGSSW